MRHRLALTAWAQVTAGQFPGLFTSVTLALTRAKLVQDRRLALWQVETMLLGCGVKLTTRAKS